MPVHIIPKLKLPIIELSVDMKINIGIIPNINGNKHIMINLFLLIG